MSLAHYLVTSTALFVVGLVGFLTRRNMIVMFLSAEMMLQGVSVTAIAFGRYHDDWGGQVEQYMSREVEHIDATSSILEAAEKLLSSNFRRFPVLRDGQLVGQISRHDVMRALDDHYLRDSR